VNAPANAAGLIVPRGLLRPVVLGWTWKQPSPEVRGRITGSCRGTVRVLARNSGATSMCIPGPSDRHVAGLSGVFATKQPPRAPRRAPEYLPSPSLPARLFPLQSGPANGTSIRSKIPSSEGPCLHRVPVFKRRVPVSSYRPVKRFPLRGVPSSEVPASRGFTSRGSGICPSRRSNRH